MPTNVVAQQIFQHATPGGTGHFAPFYYPPPFLLLILTFGLLSFFPAFVAFDGLSSAAYLLVCIRLLPRGRWAIAANPAAAITLMNGQSSGIVTALFLGRVPVLERKPFLAGLLFGALVIKPQFGLLLPLAFIAGRQWRAFAGASFFGFPFTGRFRAPARQRRDWDVSCKFCGWPPSC